VLIKHITSCSSGTANSWLGFASLHILANYYQPLNRALCVNANSVYFVVTAGVFITS